MCCLETTGVVKEQQKRRLHMSILHETLMRTILNNRLCFVYSTYKLGTVSLRKDSICRFSAKLFMLHIRYSQIANTKLLRLIH